MAGSGDGGAFSAETAALPVIGESTGTAGGEEGRQMKGRTRKDGGRRRRKNKKARLECLPVEPPKNGSCLLSHLVGQYHRRWRA